MHITFALLLVLFSEQSQATPPAPPSTVPTAVAAAGAGINRADIERHARALKTEGRFIGRFRYSPGPAK